MRCMSEAETRVQDRSAADLLTADPGAMSPLERSRAVSALLAAYPLVQVMLEGPLLGRAALPLLADAVQPGELRHLSARCYEPFEAEALLVLEREHDVQVVHVEEVAERRGLLGRVTRTTRTTRSIERRVAPASAWEVAEAFVGAPLRSQPASPRRSEAPSCPCGRRCVCRLASTSSFQCATTSQARRRSRPSSSASSSRGTRTGE